MSEYITRGVNHVALTVADLDKTMAFFTEILGYKKVGEDPGYPAAFVSDETTMLALWRARDPQQVTPFDRKSVIGLHHLALTVKPEALDDLAARLKTVPECELEFEPEAMYGGPNRHMMCTIPGSGIRIEFTAPAA